VEEQDRNAARRLAAQAIADGEPTRWFEELYHGARATGLVVPWTDLAPNPHLVTWPLLAAVTGRRALVVGCGFGDDAEWLAGQGLDVTAFDISPTAVARCRERFPGSAVRYVVADLLDPPGRWLVEPFGLVVDAYTVQVLPPNSAERLHAVRNLARLTGDILLVIARGRDERDGDGLMPWPVLRVELAPITDLGLDELAFDDYQDDESPPARRFRATYRRPRTCARSL